MTSLVFDVVTEPFCPRERRGSAVAVFFPIFPCRAFDASLFRTRVCLEIEVCHRAVLRGGHETAKEFTVRDRSAPRLFVERVERFFVGRVLSPKQTIAVTSPRC
jgi:hypothetical protein